MTEILMFLCSL